MNDKPVKKNILTISDKNKGQRLDNFLMSLDRSMPRNLVYKLCRTGQVRVNGSRSKPLLKLKYGDLVRVPPSLVSENKQPGSINNPRKFEIIFENDDYLIINKPAGMAVHSGSTIQAGVIDHLRATRDQADFLELAHRLDKDTSGCLVMAKNRPALLHFQNQQKDASCKKRYLALLSGRVNKSHWEVKKNLRKIKMGGEHKVVVQEDGQFAHSIFTLIEQWPEYFLAQVEIPTGRTHQIRAHSQYSGHPIAGDKKYGDTDFNLKMKAKGLKRLFLHASQISFKAGNGDDIIAHSGLPESLSGIVSQHS
ncbi:MAG: RluA family pseudouridine synthase [bacterium]